MATEQKGRRMTTDTTERGLERLICTALTGHPCNPAKPDWVGKPPTAYGGLGWIGGTARDYDREYCIDLAQLAAFLHETQPEVAAALDLHEDGPTRRKLLARLQGEITRRGTIDVLRHGIKHGPHHIDLFYGTPSPGNARAAERNKDNRFSVTR
jgi:type I restriction enzyme R subunit